MNNFHPVYILNALFYATVGVLFLVIIFLIWDRLTPYSFWLRIVEERNMALAILVGAIFLGICWIIAASVH